MIPDFSPQSLILVNGHTQLKVSNLLVVNIIINSISWGLGFMIFVDLFVPISLI